MSEPNLCNTHICSARHITAFLHLGTLDSSTLALCMKAMLNSQITNKKLKTAEKKKGGHLKLRYGSCLEKLTIKWEKDIF